MPASLERKGSVRGFWLSRFFRLYPLYLFAVGAMIMCLRRDGLDLGAHDGMPSAMNICLMPLDTGFRNAFGANSRAFSNI